MSINAQAYRLLLLKEYFIQPFSARSAVVFAVVAACMMAYFPYEKARLDRQRVAEAAKGVGRPKVGGPFELVDQEGKKFTDEDMKGGYSLVREEEHFHYIDE